MRIKGGTPDSELNSIRTGSASKALVFLLVHAVGLDLTF